MIVQCENNQQKYPFDPLEELASRTVETVIAEHAPPFFWKKKPVEPGVIVHFVSPARMRQMNRDAREVDRVTDVLSFPLLHWDGTSLAHPLIAGDLDFSYPDMPVVWLGDLVICPEQAQRQARRYGHTFEREIAFLSAHGALHLIGYDHDTQAGERAMLTSQETLLHALGYLRTILNREEDKDD